MEEKIVLKNCWENKYIDHEKDYVKKSLNGNITFYYDKWGAFIISRDTFGKGDRLYSCELDYIQAIKHLISINKYIKLLENRDKNNEKENYPNFNEIGAVFEEVNRKNKYDNLNEEIIIKLDRKNNKIVVEKGGNCSVRYETD